MATVLGVSESSIKRWVDDGAITSTKTAGGHRRITVPEAISFIRRQGLSIAKGELIGLPRVSGDYENTNAAIKESMLSGDQPSLERLFVDHYAAGGSVAAICDDGVKNAFIEIGELWKHQEDGIMIEHRAVDTCLGALSSLGALLPRPSGKAPIAVGGAPSGDPYLIPSLMVSLCLTELGFNATNLGPDTPWETFVTAVEQMQPVLCWVSASAPVDGEIINKADEHFGAIKAFGAEVILGGRCSEPFRDLTSCSFSSSLADFQRLANTLIHKR